MKANFHGNEGLNPGHFLQALPSIDFDKTAFGFHYFPETGFADFFACDHNDLINIASSADLHRFSGITGFAAFPFQPDAPGYIIPPFLSLSECATRRFVVHGFYREGEESYVPDLHRVEFDSQADYTARVQMALQAIESGDFEKVVLSRSVRTQFSRNQLHPFLERVFVQYPQANLMVFNIPGKGFWISASPEVLLSYGYSMLGAPQSSILSHALAGTKTIDSQSEWEEKELREHALVARFIEERFGEFVPPEAIQKWGPGEQAAGRLRHLLSLYHINGGTSEMALQLAHRLHPTPAVCGYPFQNSYGWLIEQESLDRSFFSGFSGSLHPERIKLIVNLRTACFRDENLLFFAGAGIVKDSDPDAELRETESKIDTLRSLI